MNNFEIISRAEAFVKDYLSDKEAGHNWWHIYRVRNNAMHIYSKEKKGDPLLIELSALLHDVGDDKIDPLTDGKTMVSSFLNDLAVPDEIIRSVIIIMERISFRDNINHNYERFAELDIVQDADRLDAIGAIGIARAFSYGGSKGNDIYIPGKSPRRYNNKEDYHNSDSSTINHFYEKLLLLRDKMNTASGRAMASERHDFMLTFLEHFFEELEDVDV